MTDDLEPAAVYRRAATLLRDRGWTRHEYETPEGFLCIVGAVNVAAGLPAFAGSSEPDDLSNSLCGPLDDKLGIPVAIWNDDHCESRDDAIALLEEMAAEVSS